MAIYSNGTQASDSITSLSIMLVSKASQVNSQTLDLPKYYTQEPQQIKTSTKNSAANSKSQTSNSTTNPSLKRQFSMEEDETIEEPDNKKISVKSPLVDIVPAKTITPIATPLKRQLETEEEDTLKAPKSPKLHSMEYSNTENQSFSSINQRIQLRICYPGFSTPKEKNLSHVDENLSGAESSELYRDEEMSMNQYASKLVNIFEIDYPNNNSQAVKFCSEKISVRTYKTDSILNLNNYNGKGNASPSKSSLKPLKSRQYTANHLDTNDIVELNRVTELNTNENIIFEKGIKFTSPQRLRAIKANRLLKSFYANSN